MRNRISRMALQGALIVTLPPFAVSAQDAGPDKKPDGACIAVVMPVFQGVPGNAASAAAGVRDLIAGYLKGPSLRVVAVEAKTRSQAAEEARQKTCEQLLFTTLTQKKGGTGLAKALGQAAGASAWGLPSGTSAAAAAAHAGEVGGMQAAASIAQSTKAKDEITLEYRLESAGGQVQFGPKTARRKASADGEDLVTPLVAQAAEAIVSQSNPK